MGSVTAGSPQKTVAGSHLTDLEDLTVEGGLPLPRQLLRERADRILDSKASPSFGTLTSLFNVGVSTFEGIDFPVLFLIPDFGFGLGVFNRFITRKRLELPSALLAPAAFGLFRSTRREGDLVGVIRSATRLGWLSNSTIVDR